MNGFCLKMIADKQSGKTAEYIFREHQQLALEKGHTWFSTNQHISARNEEPAELLLYFVSNSGKPTAYRAKIVFLMYEKEQFIPGHSERFAGAPFRQDIADSVVTYAPPAYADQKACTWFFVEPFEEVSEAYLQSHFLVSTKRPLSDVINQQKRTPRAIYML